MTAETFWFLATCVAALGWALASWRADAFKKQQTDAVWWQGRMAVEKEDLRKERDDARRERDDHRLGELRAMERVRELEAWIANPPKAKKGGNDAA